MPGSVVHSGQPRTRRARRTTVAAALGLAGLVGLAVFGATRFAAADREREMQTWQTRLGIVADSRAAAVDGWIAGQFAGLGQIARNAAVQLYMTALTAGSAAPGPADGADADLARAGYLRTLLTVIAHRMGFAQGPARPPVAANVSRAGISGIALVAGDGRLIAATEGMPPVAGRLARFLAAVPPGESRLLDLYRDATGSPAIAFAVPVFAVQGDADAASQIGHVLGVKQVVAELFPLLDQPGAVWKTAEALLVRRAGAAIEYLSPTRAGDAALARAFAADTPRLAAAFALERPGGFAVRRDYRGTEVLVTARRIGRAPWTLLYKIDRAEALGPADARARRLLLVFLLAIAAVAAAAIAAWRHGTSVRAARAAAEYRRLARRYEAQGRFLRQVTDSQPAAMFIVDHDNRYRFANRAALDRAGLAESDLAGKTLASVLGPAEAARYEALNREVAETGERRMQVLQSGANGDLRVVQSEHIPIADAADGDESSPGIMIVEEDITEAVAERERRERMLRRLIDSLLASLDRRDPHAADHSLRVAAVARAMALEMGLDEVDARTAELAGQLMNIGKALVPSELLVRDGPLAEEELQLVRDSLQSSVALLDGIEFDGPVVETLRQMHARWDGAGSPPGLAGEDILVTAQIVAVANAFVALTSPRAWRPAVEPEAAAGRLMGEAGGAFARRVVSALMNLVDNRGLRAVHTGYSIAPAMH